MPQTPISIPHFPLSNLNQVEHSDTQPDIVQHLVGVNRVDFTNERLVCRDSELVRFYRDGILPKREENVSQRRNPPPPAARGSSGNWPHLDYGQDEHPGPNPRG